MLPITNKNTVSEGLRQFPCRGVGCRVSRVGCRGAGVACRVSGVGCRVSRVGCLYRIVQSGRPPCCFVWVTHRAHCRRGFACKARKQRLSREAGPLQDRAVSDSRNKPGMRPAFGVRRIRLASIRSADFQSAHLLPLKMGATKEPVLFHPDRAIKGQRSGNYDASALRLGTI